VYFYNLSPIEDINTDWLRSHLRHVLDDVNHGARYAILRRGRPVAGLVPITEARALFEATRADRKYRDMHAELKRRDEDRLRQAVADLGQAEHDLATRPR
jgi:prevent-host-death family protein